jgi:hypothetical protein
MEGKLLNNVDQGKLEYILSILEQVEFGSINITIHAGEISQIDTTVKKRFTLPKSNKK